VFAMTYSFEGAHHIAQRGEDKAGIGLSLHNGGEKALSLVYKKYPT